jgi:hypothetical protein
MNTFLLISLSGITINYTARNCYLRNDILRAVAGYYSNSFVFV